MKASQRTSNTNKPGSENPSQNGTGDIFPQSWITNALLDDSFIEIKARELVSAPLPYDLENWLHDHFKPDDLEPRNEAQLEDEFIGPLLSQLGWTKVSQITIIVQGKLAKPDWCLLESPGQDNELIVSKNHALIASICESKSWGKPLDTGKADRNKNPHHQLQDYLSTLRVRFGFLTNGRIWRVYDTDKITAKKTFVEFDLQRLLSVDNIDEKAKGLALFAFFFGRDTYVKPKATDQVRAIEKAIADSTELTLAVEENLKAVIYGYSGEDSLFEVMGRAIHKANRNSSLAGVYENSVVLLFRLLFVVYFEDKNQALLSNHPFYKRYSLGGIFENIRTPSERDNLHDGIYALKQLFEILDEGAEDIDVPLFNGGLFDPVRAPLLLTPKIFDNATLRQILEKLLYKTNRGTTLFDTKRDFKNMSVSHLGRIYEGLLEFRFERATESAVYLEYQSNTTKGKVVEAYYDAYDSENIRKEKGFRAWREINIKKGEVYLRSASNSRKTSASYYTPSALSKPLVISAIDHAIASGKTFTDLRILDNACGSGHFLVEALGYLTDLALARLDEDVSLQQLVADESGKINEQLRFLNLDYVPEDAQILKRALLKRCIFGVDLNPFAVELARLSLWMDSFIFGTPLSFIEHHVQHGNALMGASVQDFINFNAKEAKQHDLFVDNLSDRFDELRSVMQELDSMRDTTAAEIERSKALWKNSIAPKLNLLSRALSFICTGRALSAEGEDKARQALEKTPNLISQLFGDANTKNAALAQVETYAQRYHFFHYEVAFPEAFAGDRKGFDIIIGNPPWDKTKFSDTDFFPQYHSNYRILKNTEKLAVQKRLLGSEHIAAAYRATQRSKDIANEYYKDKAAFPLNKGSGDGNLFRLFVERNLWLLAPGGSLNYVLPSALMFEDGSCGLRKHILTNCRMSFFYSFENRDGIFQDVHRSYKFSIMQVINGLPRVPKENVIDTAFYVRDPIELNDPKRHVFYPLDMLKSLSPEQWALMELRDGADLPILEKCYRAFPPLSPDWLDFRRELHLTDDKDLFIENIATGLLPLFEGKMIWQYSHKFDAPQYWLDSTDFDDRLRSKELHRMAQDIGVSKSETIKYGSAIRYDREFIRLSFRDVASDTNERTLIFALLPRNCGAGNTLHLSIPKKYLLDDAGDITTHTVSSLRLLFALAWFNSLPVDWIARFMIQIHANKTYLFRIPMPQPSDEEIRNNINYAQLAKNALLLSLSADWGDFAELAPLFSIQRQDTPVTAKQQDILRAQNDKIVAKLYGITDDEFAHLLSGFNGMANKRPEYLTLLQ